MTMMTLRILLIPLIKVGIYKYALDHSRGDTNMSSGLFPGIEKFVTSRLVLEDVVEKGFKELVMNKDNHIKIMVSPKRGNSAR
jgi:hypothetical protein